MKTSKNSVNKSRQFDPEIDMDDSSEETSREKTFQDDDDDFDMPLDDLDGFDNFGDDDDDDY